MSDKPVKFDTIPQLEVILKSIDLEDSALLTPILDSREVDSSEKIIIQKYMKLYEISGRPSVALLQKEIPGRNFEVDPIEKEALPDYIQLYLYNKKNMQVSKNLMELSAKVRSEGLNESIVSELSKLTKSEVVQHKFTDIADEYIDRYENQEYAIGIPTGISFVDEMVGGIHKGEVTCIAGYAGHCKTTLAVNSAYNALKSGFNVLYCSFEVPKESIYNDFLSRHSNDNKFKMRIPHYGLKKRSLKPEQWDYVKEVIRTRFKKYGWKTIHCR
ncbi:MAG: hypothetical protein IJF92_00725 [Bacilli bacterium]|nr:hypothetical protein [Bacilli bacterium]MBQ3307662.1 hypothetical protein [Bacilli bacterium]